MNFGKGPQMFRSQQIELPLPVFYLYNEKRMPRWREPCYLKNSQAGAYSDLQHLQVQTTVYISVLRWKCSYSKDQIFQFCSLIHTHSSHGAIQHIFIDVSFTIHFKEETFTSCHLDEKVQILASYNQEFQIWGKPSLVFLFLFLS